MSIYNRVSTLTMSVIAALQYSTLKSWSITALSLVSNTATYGK